MKRTFQATITRWALIVLLYCTACTFSNGIALAQLQLTTMQAGCPGNIASCPSVVTIGPEGELDAVKNEPYQAQAITEIKQTLSDGSHTDLTTTATIARDSEGRTVHIQKLRNGVTVTTIFDPVVRTSTEYSSDSKVAHVTTLPTTSTLPSGAMLAVGTSSDTNQQVAVPIAGAFFLEGHIAASQTTAEPDTTTESLGTKTIDGFQVTGTRSIHTIPAGTIGNDKDITITRDTWYSALLSLDMLSVQDDPRFGHTTYSLTNIQHGEPDSALFQVPPDYTVETKAMPLPPG